MREGGDGEKSEEPCTMQNVRWLNCFVPYRSTRSFIPALRPVLVLWTTSNNKKRRQTRTNTHIEEPMHPGVRGVRDGWSGEKEGEGRRKVSRG